MNWYYVRAEDLFNSLNIHEIILDMLHNLPSFSVSRFSQEYISFFLTVLLLSVA
jgi:hypothetical protein